MINSSSHLQAQFIQHRPQLMGHQVTWLHDYRQQAFDFFSQHGMPVRALENWKYTDLGLLNNHPFQSLKKAPLLSEHDIKPFLLNADFYRMVFIDGNYAPHLSLSAPTSSIIFASLNEMIATRPDEIKPYFNQAADFCVDDITALNASFMNDGVFLKMADEAVIDKPIHLLFISTAQDNVETMHHLHNLILAGQNSQATLIWHYVSLNDHAHFSTQVNQVVLQENASLEYYQLQQENQQAYHLGLTKVQQAKNSHLNSFNFDLGAKLARHDFNTRLNDQGSACTLTGLYFATGKQHVDNHTLIEHLKPHCNSYENYKGIIDGKAHAVFNGKIIVHPHAQKTCAHQSNKNLLLSPHAEIDTKPQLEVYTDDIRCTHGATVGQLDENHIFYLQSRGIDHDTAKTYLTYGFAQELINQVQITELRDRIEKLLKELLQR